MVDDCKKGFFRCWDGSCIPLSKQCDGISDCSQNDDEIECAHNSSFAGQCGKNSDAVQFTWDPRIVGGSRAISGSYPWMVPLYHYEKVDAELVSIFFCGSTILSERWILTAAHCVSWAPGRPGDLFGLLGTIDRTNFNSTKVYFDKVVVHPEYNNATQTNDIALLHTNKTITFNEAVTPICIPHQEYPILKNETCITIGWGDLYSSYGGKFTDLLRQVRVEIVDQQTCERTYGGIREIQITNNHICAGNGGRDACNGDSGGPLLCLKDNSWFQFGVTSSGHGCGDAEYPGVYTDVRRYFNWIQQESSPEQTIDICGDDETQGYSGFLTSPNFPQNYGNYHDCSKLLSPPVGKRVEISFLIFELEDDDGTEEGRCLYDSLTIVVGEEQFSGVKYCGNVAPYNFTTNQEVMFNFVVDHSKTRQGFQIFWKMVDDCNDRSYRCWDGSCIPASKRCDGVPDCPNQTDEIECVHPTSSYGECGKNSAPAQFVWEKKTNRRQSLLQRKSRIVGGHSARSKSYPWTVPLFFKNETSQKYICVASIISDRWLMTAAHCVNRRIARDLFGLLGTNDKSDFNSTKVQFDKIVTHPDFDESLVFWRDDIALLRTTQPITFDDKVGPVCIPNKDVPQSDICIVVGWGLFYKGSTRYPDLLHQTTLPLLNHSFCRRAYPLKMEGQICAGDFESGGRDACQGDSGGPLLCFQNNSWFQFGVTSIGSGCGRAQRPGIYTNVRSYYNWIQQESSPEQTIAITCDPSRTAPTNGEVLCTNTNLVDSVCTYSCNEGYLISDNSLSTTVCNDDGDADGEWSSQPPQCIDVDECAEGNPCAFRCVNTVGGFECTCPQGYQLKHDGYMCEDTDECASADLNDCNENGMTCRNIIGHFICLCPSGYRRLGADNSCVDINECEQNLVCTNGRCINMNGTYRCECNEGYNYDEENKLCLDVDECVRTPSPCMYDCRNSMGGYECVCPAGYQLDRDNSACVDVDECVRTPSPCMYDCRNTMGGYECVCPAGYQLDRDNSACVDLDECATKQHNRFIHNCRYICINTVGSFRYGFVKLGQQCVDRNECLDYPNICAGRGICRNDPGGYHCECPRGYRLDEARGSCIGDSRRKPIAVSGTRTERQMRLLMCERGGNGRYVITRCESYFNNKNEYQFCKRMKKQRRQGECKKSRKQQSQRKIGRKITDV